jgi:hypothetical protein
MAMLQKFKVIFYEKTSSHCRLRHGFRRFRPRARSLGSLVALEASFQDRGRQQRRRLQDRDARKDQKSEKV